MADFRLILMRAVVLAAICAGSDDARAGPFLLQPGSSTGAVNYWELGSPGFGSVFHQVFDFQPGVTSADIQIEQGLYHGTSASAESAVTASFDESHIAVFGSATGEVGTVSAGQAALARGTFSGNVKFFVDTSDFYRISGSFASVLTGGGTGFAKVTLNTPSPYQQVLFAGGSAALDFNDLIFLNAGSYVMTYQGQTEAYVTNGATGTGMLAYELHLTSAVPEPSSLALVGGVTAAVGWLRRRRARGS